MILALLSLLRGWTVIDRIVTKIAGHFTTWPAEDFSRFTSSPLGPQQLVPVFTAQPPRTRPLRLPEPQSIAPGAFEIRFTRLQNEGRFDEMWTMLADDAQRSWGSEANFVEGMSNQAGAAKLIEAEVGSVSIVPEWTDRTGNRTYKNVARLGVRYRLKHEWRELTVYRQVHLVPAADGWRTLCYPQAS